MEYIDDLCKCVLEGDFEGFDKLIENGVQVDLINSSGRHPLSYAYYCVEMTEKLIKSGANPYFRFLRVQSNPEYGYTSPYEDMIKYVHRFPDDLIFREVLKTYLNCDEKFKNQLD